MNQVIVSVLRPILSHDDDSNNTRFSFALRPHRFSFLYPSFIPLFAMNQNDYLSSPSHNRIPTSSAIRSTTEITLSDKTFDQYFQTLQSTHTVCMHAARTNESPRPPIQMVWYNPKSNNNYYSSFLSWLLRVWRPIACFFPLDDETFDRDQKVIDPTFPESYADFDGLYNST